MCCANVTVQFIQWFMSPRPGISHWCPTGVSECRDQVYRTCCSDRTTNCRPWISAYSQEHLRSWICDTVPAYSADCRTTTIQLYLDNCKRSSSFSSSKSTFAVSQDCITCPTISLICRTCLRLKHRILETFLFPTFAMGSRIDPTVQVVGGISKLTSDADWQLWKF